MDERTRVMRVAAGLFGLSLVFAGNAAHTQVPLRGAGWMAERAAASTDGAAFRHSSDGATGLAELFGRSHIDRLLRSTEVEDRLRGLERAAGAHTPEALALLLRFRDDGDGATSDPRTLLALTRGLAGWVERPSARVALTSIVRAPGGLPATPNTTTTGDPVLNERRRAARIALARSQAAFALAGSGHPDAIKSLLDIVGDAGPGQAAATEALTAFPPEAPTTFPDNPSPAIVEIIAAVGDLRSIGAVLTAARSSDAGVRAAALKALVGLGDPGVAETARAWRHDPDLRVRLAACETLVRLRDADAEAAVEDLVVDDETAAAGLRFAQGVQGEGVIRAAAARAIASGNLSLRLAAVAALSQQSSKSALGALVTLASVSDLAGPAANGLARSRNASAMAAIEELGVHKALRRLAARAYFVRRYTKNERSLRLDALIDDLARSEDGRDRAVALQASVALDEAPVEAAWMDRDARVRRAATLGAMGRLDTHTATVLLQRLAIEPDATTRLVLAGALGRGDGEMALSTSELISRVATGEPDAPAAALALGRTSDDAQSAVIDALLASQDPFVRAHALRGLGSSAASNAGTRIALAYRWEESAEVRRTIVEVLSTRSKDRAWGAGRETLDLAARLDPDPETRGAARRALAGMELARPPTVPEVAWITLVPLDGTQFTADSTGLIVTSEGAGMPIVFDDDGFALVLGVRSGETRLRLAARLTPYSSGAP